MSLHFYHEPSFVSSLTNEQKVFLKMYLEKDIIKNPKSPLSIEELELLKLNAITHFTKEAWEF